MGTHYNQSFLISDDEFDRLCPDDLRDCADTHWTPVEVARMAAAFLVTSPETRVLDIGSGVGKFCVAGRAFAGGAFTGVEHRKRLCDCAKRIAAHLGLNDLKFLHARLQDIDFMAYDAFYYYNSFYENLTPEQAIDLSVDLQAEWYEEYCDFLRECLSQSPPGTRLVTYWADQVVPSCYSLIKTGHDGSLKCWQKS